jgi:hypothetical protein
MFGEFHLQKIIEILLAPQAVTHAENLRGHASGIQLHIIFGSVPKISRVR